MPAKQILFIFGDSITYGEWDTAGGWANRLRAHYDQQVLPLPRDYVIVYNLGIPSDTSMGIAQRITQETQSRLSPNPDPETIQFIIAIGTNDSRWLIDENKRGVEQDAFKENLNSITEQARTFTEQITYVSLLPCIEADVDAATKRQGWVESFDNKSIQEFNSMIKNHCAQNSLGFIDVYEPFVDSQLDTLLCDGLHPNDKGHALVFELILNHLQNTKKCGGVFYE